MIEPDLPDEDEDHPFSVSEIRDLIRGAELLRYAEGTAEDAGTVMAVFRTPEGRGIGLTMQDSSKTPQKLVGETVRDERPYVRGTGVTYGSAFILFEGLNAAYDKIIVKNTAAIGVYEVDLDEGEDR